MSEYFKFDLFVSNTINNCPVCNNHVVFNKEDYNVVKRKPMIEDYPYKSGYVIYDRGKDLEVLSYSSYADEWGGFKYPLGDDLSDLATPWYCPNCKTYGSKLFYDDHENYERPHCEKDNCEYYIKTLRKYNPDDQTFSVIFKCSECDDKKNVRIPVIPQYRDTVNIPGVGCVYDISMDYDVLFNKIYDNTSLVGDSILSVEQVIEKLEVLAKYMNLKISQKGEYRSTDELLTDDLSVEEKLSWLVKNGYLPEFNFEDDDLINASLKANSGIDAINTLYAYCKQLKIDVNKKDIDE